MGEKEAIERRELVEIVAAASEGCAESTRTRLTRVAESTDAVAVGWFHCDGVKCPMSQAGWRTNRTFQEAFDRAMAGRFGREWDKDRPRPVEPFVVVVEGAVQ